MLKNLKEKVKIFIEYYFLWLITVIVFGLSIWLLCLGLPNVYKANSHDKQLFKEYTIDEEKLSDTLNDANKRIEKRSVIVGSITLTNSEIFKNDKVDINEQANKELEKNSVVIGTITLTTPVLFKEDKGDIQQKLNKIEGLNKKLENKGVFGDSAGLVTAAFAGLAFFGFLLSFIFQQKELKARNKDLNKQQFESTFFNMLKTQENIISNLEYGSEGSSFYGKGRNVFEKIFEDNVRYSKLQQIVMKLNNNSKKENISQSKVSFNIFNIDKLSNYFTFMYRIIKFVDENKIFTYEEKSNYIDILRATLSTYEIIILFYNGLSQGEDIKMKTFIERYSLLDHLKYNLLYKEEHLNLYDIRAYGNNEYLIQKYNKFEGI